MSEQRLGEIADLLARCRRRLDPERAYALLRACEDLLAAVPRQGRLL